MLRLFRRPPRDNFGPDTEEAGLGDEGLGLDAESDPAHSTGRPRRPLKAILAFGIFAVGLGALYLSWSGGRRDEPVLPALLPPGRPPLAQGGTPPPGAPMPPVANAPTPPPSTVPAPAPGPSAPPTPQAEPPTFYVPLQRDSRETAGLAPGQATGVPAGAPYTVLAQASHEATVENLRTQIAELKLKKLRAELEADELRKNPKRLFKDEKPLAESKREPRPADRLARVPARALPTPGPTPAPAQPQSPPAAAPPQMRVRMVTLEPKEALIEASGGDSRGWFKVQEGQKLPDFVVTRITEDGVTISLAGREFFYPLGGYALGAPQDNQQPGSRQAADSARRREP